MRKLLTLMTCAGIALTLGIGGASTAASAGTKASPQTWALSSFGTATCSASGACTFSMSEDGASGSITLQFTAGATSVHVGGSVNGYISSTVSSSCTISGSGTANAAWPNATSATVSGSENCTGTVTVEGKSVSSGGSYPLGTLTATRVSGGPAPMASAPTKPKPEAKAVKKATAPTAKQTSSWKSRQAYFYIENDPTPIQNGRCEPNTRICTMSYEPTLEGPRIMVTLTMKFPVSGPPQRVEIEGEAVILYPPPDEPDTPGPWPKTCKFTGEGTANTGWPYSTKASGNWNSACPYSPLGHWSIDLETNKK